MIKAETDEKSSHYHSEDSGCSGSRSTTGDTNALGSVIAGSNSVLLNDHNLNVITLQDVLMFFLQVQNLIHIPSAQTLAAKFPP